MASSSIYTVYMATNTVNGKRYIGVAKNFLKRKRKHIWSGRMGKFGCPRFHAALAKYGADVFVWEILSTFSAKSEAYQHEYELVELLKPEYNACRGGKVGPDEAWNKIAVVCLEDGLVYRSGAEACRSYSISGSEMPAALRGKGAPKGLHFQRYVQPMSEAERLILIADMDRKRALARKTSVRQLTSIEGGKDKLGRSAAGPMRRARGVVCLTDGKIFESISQAATYYGVAKSALNELCQGKHGRKTVGGLRFAYEEVA